MILAFTKMNGAGNDFVLLDNRERRIELTREQVVRLCHRQFGIGADGLLLLEPCASGAAEWAWQFFNSDGSRAEMCGNGARCFARFIQRLTGARRQTTFLTGAGVIAAMFEGARVIVNLTCPKDFQLDQSVSLSAGTLTVHSINTGVPHAVIFVDDLEHVPVQALGAELRHHARFAPKGTNVNFVQSCGPNLIRVRTYERGVEGETLACGTGVTAAALVASRVLKFRSPVNVLVRSGDELEVSFVESDGAVTSVTLAGPAEFVFEGKIEL